MGPLHCIILLGCGGKGRLNKTGDAYRKILDLLLIYEWIPTLKMTCSGPVPNSFPLEFLVKDTISDR